MGVGHYASAFGGSLNNLGPIFILYFQILQLCYCILFVSAFFFKLRVAWLYIRFQYVQISSLNQKIRVTVNY